MDSEEELPDIPYTAVTSGGRNVTSEPSDPGPSTERHGAKRSVPLSAEEKRRLAAERKRRSRAAKSAAKKEVERSKRQADMERLR